MGLRSGGAISTLRCMKSAADNDVRNSEVDSGNLVVTPYPDSLTPTQSSCSQQGN